MLCTIIPKWSIKESILLVKLTQNWNCIHTYMKQPYPIILYMYEGRFFFLHYCKIQKFVVKKKGGGKMARDLQKTFFLFTLIISFKWEWYSRILDSGQVSTWSRIKISIVQEKVQNLRQCGLKCNLQCNTTIRCRKNRIERR